MNPQNTFIFQGYEADIAQGVVLFHYQIVIQDRKIDFTEKISFPPVSAAIPQKLLANVLNNLLLIGGISYWKLYCPKQIEIVPFSLTKEQADFWNIVYTKGLGEFFYKNKIDYRGLVEFPFVDKQINSRPDFVQSSSRLLPTSKTTSGKQDRSLLSIGGGKDSIVSAELLKKCQKPFTPFMVNTSGIQEEVITVMESGEPLIIKRTIDPKLLELNKENETYNGHIPVSVVWAFLGLFAAVLYDYRYIIVSNEKSANYGNVEYLGQEVNHQWSKSEEFEKLFQQYSKTYITPSITYFSLLRALTEVKITALFSEYEKYFPVFSSCNRNFRIVKDDNVRWCGECPKCVFVFTMLAAFLSKEKVIGIFGKNLFADEKLPPLFKELLGLGEIKPFECVGTPEEMQYALYLVHKKGEFKETLVMHMFQKEAIITDEEAEMLKKELFAVDTSSLPEEFRSCLQDF